MIEIIHYEKMDKGSLVAKISVRIPKWGNFIIHGLAIMKKDKSRWLSFPNYKKHQDGQEKWVPVVEFAESEMMKEFSRKVFEVFDLEY